MRSFDAIRQADRLALAKGLVGLVIFGGAVLAIAHDWLGIGGAAVEAVVGPTYGAVVLAAAFACLLRARASGAERAAWIALGASILAWAAADVYWRLVILNDPSPPFPSPADIGFLAFYPLAVMGLALLVRARAEELDWRLWMDGAIATLGTAAIGAALVFEFVAERTSGTTLEELVTLAYPVSDVILLGVVVGVVALTGCRPGRTWTLLALGVASLVAADIVNTLEAAGEVGKPASNWIEPIYVLGAVFLGAEAWQREAKTIRADTRQEAWREMVVPATFAAVMMVLFGLQYFREAGAVTTILWWATMLAVIARLALSARENRRLLDQVRTDQLTGLGSRARLESDLEEGCRRADREPLTLLLLDLNGFKQYNDRFGHPAGDAMLRRLGRQLRRATGAGGIGYRIGGDEFAVISPGTAEHAEPVARRAAEALSAAGESYELSAAWGAASVPADAVDAASAIRLADTRMYAQKQSRQLARAAARSSTANGTARLRSPLDRKALEQRH